MSKIEVHDLSELILSDYPKEYVERLINQVLILSKKIKTDYPNYEFWFLNKQVPGIYNGTRNIIIAHKDTEILGFISLKAEEEKKICTFYVEKNYQRQKIGTLLVEKAINYLETDKPLITIPENKLHEFIRIGKKYGWQITDKKENLYRIGTPEIIVNGTLDNRKIQKYSQLKLKK